MTIGTKSVLFGAHCFFIHPWFVALAWWKLYGFPLDPRLWVAFFVHDLGYIGKANMDGPEGETHPLLGARIMHILFDRPAMVWKDREDWASTNWYDFTLYHSRYYAKAAGQPFSRLCVADKLAFCLTPKWLYLPMVKLTGELAEYLENAKHGASRGVTNRNPSEWHDSLNRYMREWVRLHRDGGQDTWTSVRHRPVTTV